MLKFISIFITEKIVLSARYTASQNGFWFRNRYGIEKRAVLYSTPQPPSPDFGCVTISYAVKGVRLQLYVTQGTLYTNSINVFRSELDNTIFTTTSVQTPMDIPYMVNILIVLTLMWTNKNILFILK